MSWNAQRRWVFFSQSPPNTTQVLPVDLQCFHSSPFIWLHLISLQFQPLPGDGFRARRSRGGRGKRGWRSSRTSSSWRESWWCLSRASTTSTPRRTSDTPTPWRRRRGPARRRRTGGSLCCSTFIKRWGMLSQLLVVWDVTTDPCVTHQLPLCVVLFTHLSHCATLQSTSVWFCMSAVT